MEIVTTDRRKIAWFNINLTLHFGIFEPMRSFFLLILLVFTSFCWSQTPLQNEYALAENYLRQSQYEKAIQIYERLYQRSPFNTTYLQRLINCYQQTSKFKLAEELLTSKLKTNKEMPYLYVFLGYNFEKQFQKENAEIQYKKAIEYTKIKPNYAGIVGRLFKDYNLLDYAIQTYEIGMEKNKSSNYNFQIAQIYGEKGDFERMFQSYAELVDKNSSYLNVVQRFASRYLSDNPDDEINSLFKRTLLRKAISKPKDEWNILLSWFFALQGDFGKALQQEKAIYERKPEDLSEIFRLGRNALSAQDYDASKACYDYILEKTQNRGEQIDAQRYLLEIAVATKNPEVERLFASVFDAFGHNQSTIKIQLVFADYLTFDKGLPDKGQEVLEKALTLTTSKYTKARIQLKLGEVLVFRGLYNSALINFSKIQSQLKNSQIAQEARFKTAQTSYFKGDFTWAKAQLKVLKSSTTQTIANDAVDLFLKITDNEPVDSVPTGLTQLAKAELFQYQKKTEKALSIVDELIENKDLFPNGLTPSEVIFDDAFFLKAKLHLELQQFDLAIQSLEKIVKTDPQSFLADDIYFMLAEVYNSEIKDIEKAKIYYQKIIFEYPSSIYLVEARKKFRQIRGDNL